MTNEQAAARQAGRDCLVRELVEALGDLLALPTAVEELKHLDRGIGTATSSAAWLRARAVLAKARSQQ